VILPYSRKCKNFASGIDAIKCKACTLCLVCDIVGHNCAIGNVARAQAVQEGLPRPFIVSPVNYILPVGDAPALKARSLAAGARPLFCITTSSANQDSVVECCMSEQGSRNDYVRVQEWLRGRLRLLAGRQRRMHRRDDRLVWCESQPGWKSTNCGFTDVTTPRAVAGASDALNKGRQPVVRERQRLRTAPCVFDT
jgi:hypothetical protein